MQFRNSRWKSRLEPANDIALPTLRADPHRKVASAAEENDGNSRRPLSLLHELVPDAAVIALLVDLNAPETPRLVSEVQAAAGTLRLQFTASDIDMAFASLVRERASALVVGAGAFLVSRRDQIIALAVRHAIPAIYGFREYSADGGLVSYGNDIGDAFRRAGVYAGRILKGDKPADLPVERTTKFELVINLKTAKGLGLTVPPALIARADEVIQ